MHHWDAFQSSQCNFKIITPLKSSASYPTERAIVAPSKHLCVLVLLDGPSFLWVLQTWLGPPARQLCWHRPGSLLPRQRTFFLTPLLPDHCYALTVGHFPAALHWQNTRKALPAHFAPAWQALATFCVAGRVSIWGACLSCWGRWTAESNIIQLEKPKVNSDVIVLCCCGFSPTPRMYCCWISFDLRCAISCSNWREVQCMKSICAAAPGSINKRWWKINGSPCSTIQDEILTSLKADRRRCLLLQW